jgi:hypothetical protein
MRLKSSATLMTSGLICSVLIFIFGTTNISHKISIDGIQVEVYS